MDINTQDLCAALAALRTSGRGRRYTPELRDQVITAVRSGRACGGCVATADGGPERVVPGGRYSLTFGAKVATDC